jgi:hypothetical protein
MSDEKKPVHINKQRRATVILLLLAFPVLITYLNNRATSSRKIASTEQEAQLDTAMASSDLSGSNPTAFQKAFKYQLLKDSKVTDFSDGKRLHLGHFFMKDQDGATKVSVCQRYPYIELNFSADGVAVSGDIPHTVIQGRCNVAADGLHLEGIVVDLPPGDYHWVWTGIKLYNSDKTDYLEVTGYEIISVLGTPLSFSE